MEKTNVPFVETDKQVAKTLNVIEPKIKELIKDNEFFVLRSKRTGEILNVSYSRYGLRWTTDKNRRLIYFKNAQLRHKKDEYGNMMPYFHKLSVDGLEKSDSVVVEKFIPKDHYLPNKQNSLDARLQVIEYRYVSKALKMLYWVPENRIVFSSAEEIDNEEIVS
jgi:hypothetical protein